MSLTGHEASMVETLPDSEAKPQMVFNAEVARPVVESKSGALYQPDRLVE